MRHTRMMALILALAMSTSMVLSACSGDQSAPPADTETTVTPESSVEPEQSDAPAQPVDTETTVTPESSVEPEQSDAPAQPVVSESVAVPPLSSTWTKEDYLKRNLTDEQLSELKAAPIETLREEISTVADAAAFLEQYSPRVFSGFEGEIRLDVDFLYLEHFNNVATTPQTYAAFAAWCITDDFEDVQYVIVTTMRGSGLRVAASLALPTTKGWYVMAPGQLSEKFFDDDHVAPVMVSQLSELRGVLPPAWSGDPRQIFTAPADQRELVFSLSDTRAVVLKGTASTVFDLTEEEVRAKRVERSWTALEVYWDRYGLPDCMKPTLNRAQTEALVGKDLDTVAAAVKTVGDVWCYFALSGYEVVNGDLKLPDGEYTWSFNRPPKQVFERGEGNCGGSSGLVAYLLQGDYEEVGLITLTAKVEVGGGHVINYLRSGNTYYALDGQAIVICNYEFLGAPLGVGETLAEAGKQWIAGTNGEFVLLHAYESTEGDLPSAGIPHKKGCWLPEQYRDRITILVENAAEGYTYQWKRMSDEVEQAIYAIHNSSNLPEQAPEGSKDPMSRALTDEQLEQLKWADAKTLQAWISTVPDAVAFLDQFEPAVYDALSAMEVLETDVEFALDLHRTEATAPSTYLIFAAWCLADDQPESKYVVSLIENGGQPVLLYSLAVPVVDGYLIISPVVLSQRGSGPYGHEQMVVSELTGLGSRLKPQFVGRTIVCAVLADVMQDSLVFRGGNGGIETTGGTAQEVYRMSDAEKAALEQAEAEAWAKVARTLNVADYGMPAAIGNTTLNYDSAYALVGQDPEVIAKTVKTVGDVLQYMIAARFSYNAPSAYTPWYGDWGFDAPGDVQLKQNYGCCCGGFANTVSYLLRGDYEKVGTLRWVGGGNHTISWVYTGGKYYVFDFTQYCAGGQFNNYGSVVTVLDKLEDFYNAMPETYSYFPKSEVVIMVAFEAAEAMYPSHWGDPPNFAGLTFPAEAEGKITVIYQKDPDRGVYYKDVAIHIPGWSD